MKKVWIAMIAGVAMAALAQPVLASCGACGGDAKAASAEHSHDDANHEHYAKVGCATCTFDMEGVSGCKTAINVHDEVYLVEGGDLDAHAAGLCSAEPKQAKVVGHVHGDKFVAESIELITDE